MGLYCIVICRCALYCIVLTSSVMYGSVFLCKVQYYKLQYHTVQYSTKHCPGAEDDIAICAKCDLSSLLNVVRDREANSLLNMYRSVRYIAECLVQYRNVLYGTEM